MATDVLDQFQLDALHFMDGAKGRMILGDPMGARKTGTTLSWLAAHLDGPRTRGEITLIVAPKAVHGHWFREASRFHPYAGHYHGAGSAIKRRDALCRLLKACADGFDGIYVTSYESMKRDEELLRKAKFDTHVFDEAHRLKGRRTGVALAANAVTKGVQHLLLLTGTPVINGAYELWQYLHMLDRKAYPAFWAWAEEHFRIEIRVFQGNRKPTRIIHEFLPHHEVVVRAQLAGLLLQRPIEDLFPDHAWTQEAEHVVIPVQLTPAERKAYDQLIKFGWTQLALEQVVTDNALSLNTRLQQIASEWGALDASLGNGAKVDAATELVVDLVERGPVVVFAQYQKTCDRLVENLQRRGLNALPYHGGIATPLKDTINEAFTDGHLDVIVGTLASLGEGVDGLQKRSHQVVMLDRHWTHAKNDQAIGRLRRSGQKSPVTVYHLMATDTIDTAVVAACTRKANVVEVLAGRPTKDAIYGKIEP